jgi:DNA-binding CsgD family transcriptional regulator
MVAVAGRRVSHRLLAAVAGLTDRQLDGALRAAVASQLLVTRPGQDGYDVRHGLLREMTDADLLPGERARLHARLAQTLTGRPELADSPPAVAAAELAAHWDAAGELERALPAAVEAGLAAERAYAFPEALLATKASRARAEQALGAAHAVAVRLGAVPLRRELELLAQRGRVRLEAPAEPSPATAEAPSVAASLGLTQREAEVLALVAAGRTNRQIGQALFITPKTASIHVSRILAKLGVAGRGEAAAIAHRLGLDKQ